MNHFKIGDEVLVFGYCTHEELSRYRLDEEYRKLRGPFGPNFTSCLPGVRGMIIRQNADNTNWWVKLELSDISDNVCVMWHSMQLVSDLSLPLLVNYLGSSNDNS